MIYFVGVFSHTHRRVLYVYYAEQLYDERKPAMQSPGEIQDHLQAAAGKEASMSRT